MPAAAEDRPGAASIVVRTAAATLGAYAVAYFLTSALTGGLFRLGLDRADSVMSASSIALLVFPAVSIWAFAERRLVVVAAAPVMTALILAVLSAVLHP